jgi:hypothetical protein
MYGATSDALVSDALTRDALVSDALISDALVSEALESDALAIALLNENVFDAPEYDRDALLTPPTPTKCRPLKLTLEIKETLSDSGVRVILVDDELPCNVM